MRRRIGWLTVTLIITIIFTSANASGLFPSMDEMFGTSMPSIGLIIGREASEQSDTETGSQEKYLDVSEDDYLAFGQYLSGIGAKVEEYKTEGNTIIVKISVRNASMVFSYDWSALIAIVTYPSGTRAETVPESVKSGESILPPVGGVMPSAEFAINRKPDNEKDNNGQLILEWNEFSDEDYMMFNAYLGEIGAELKDCSLQNGILEADISINGFFFSFVFDWNIQSAQIVYPEGTVPETSRWNTSVGKGYILPELSSLGKELPRISVALKREPVSCNMLSDGSMVEVYQDFSEADYNTFSKYLQKMNCTLDDYKIAEDGTMIIHLSNESGKMSFSYDSINHIGMVEYPSKTRVEKAWAPTPKPTVELKTTPIPENTTEPESYSVTDCLSIAFNCFYNQRWNNPESVTIHNYSYSLEGDNIVFLIDYSAENQFGGTSRKYYIIAVDRYTGKITLDISE